MTASRSRCDWSASAAAYLLGALDDDERRAFEAHLDTCEACRAEVADLAPGVELLATGVERVEPPAGLRARLMAEVEALTDVEAANQRLEGAGVELVICELTASTVETTRSLQQRSLEKGVPVVLLADADEEGLLLDAANAGAGGFFTNDCPPQEFFAGLELVLEGQQAVGRRLIPGILARLTRARKTVRS